VAKKIAVIGLGDFGENLVKSLMAKGAEVLAIDDDVERIEEIKDHVSAAVKLDSTDLKALKAQDLQNMDAVIVSIGQQFENSILTIMNLLTLKPKKIIARATSSIHREILKKLGIEEDYIISPEERMAEIIATTLMHEGVLRWEDVGNEKDYKIAYLKAPNEFVGKTLMEIDMRTRFNVNLITILKKVKHKSQRTEEYSRRSIGVPTPGTVIEEDDELVVFGREKDIAKLTE